MPPVQADLLLPCGVTLHGRLFKGAMSEGLGDRAGAPRPELGTLYARWARSGIGLLITGNVMIDARALGEPGNVILEDDRHLAAFHDWAVRGQRDGTQVWVQLNHPGKQAPRGLNAETVAPSALPFPGAMGRAFATPRALTREEIHGLSERFAASARLAQRAGFGGVQLHAAHGYLLSQFLSPRHNVRQDEYGGSPENRRRFLLETFAAVRAAVGPGFPVSVKLNSSDFVRGGLSEEESLEVVRTLGEAGCDLIEISGGTYEKPMMMLGRGERGGFFADFSRRAREVAGVPVGVTGGFRDADVIREALDSGAADLIGLGRPLAVDPDFAGRVLRGETLPRLARPGRTGVRAVDRSGSFDTLWHEDALRRHSRGQPVRPDEDMRLALLRILASTGVQAALRQRRA